jgi:hypothetical protein
LPEALEISGEDYGIRSDFKVVLRFFELTRDDRILERHKGYTALKMFFKERIPFDTDAAFNALGWFIRCGKPEEQVRQKRPVFDFAHDAGIIFSSFWEQYGIDLTAAGLHWWKFSALFAGLNEDTMFRNVVRIRTKSEDGLDAKSRQELRELKKAWALPPEVFRSKKTDALAAALKAGDAAKIQRALQ